VEISRTAPVDKPAFDAPHYGNARTGMIRIERGAEAAPGIWKYSVPSLALCGKSRQPLLDACRQIKRVLGPTGARACLFRGTSTVPDISCLVEKGALLTVKEPDKGKTIHFANYQAWIDLRASRAVTPPISQNAPRATAAGVERGGAA
jgi:hypothetical protein